MERLDHGEFLKWIKKEFGWTQPSAWAFMQVYKRFKLSNFDNLQIDVSALYRIAAPSTPEAVRVYTGGTPASLKNSVTSERSRPA